jgi:hypothetical protein
LSGNRKGGTGMIKILVGAVLLATVVWLAVAIFLDSI